MSQQVDLPDDLHKRLEAFRPLLAVVIEEDVGLDECVAAVLDHGLNIMLAELVGSADVHALIASLQQLAAQHPEAVYRYVAETMTAGAAAERESARKRIGFAASPEN